jgi:hypothetical protein
VSRTDVVVGLGIVLCAGSLFWLQGRFDDSDHTKSIRLVRGLRNPSGTETFEQYLIRTEETTLGTWSSEVTGGCRGVARVTFTVPGPPPRSFAWDVDLPAQAVHPNPGSPGGEARLKAFVEQRELEKLELPPRE